jgi:hypothetical protein
MTLPSPHRLLPADILNRAFAGFFLSTQIEAFLDRMEGAA